MANLISKHISCLLSSSSKKHKRNNVLLQAVIVICSCFFINYSVAQSATEASNASAIQQISEQIKTYANTINKNNQYTRIEYDVTLPDPRLNLETCKEALKIENRSARRNIGRLTIRVSCEAAKKPWAVNVSLNLIAYDKIIVSSRSIPKGSKITQNMLNLAERDVTRLHQGYFKEFKHVVGSVSKYAISGNKALKPGNLLPPRLVTKGEKVVINATASGLNIRATGIALSDGILGEVVKVKNSQTTRIIEGRVSAAGQVMVSL